MRRIARDGERAAGHRLAPVKWHVELAQQRERVAAPIERVRPEIEVDAVANLRRGAAAEVLRLLEHDHRAAGARDPCRREQSREPAADHGDVDGLGDLRRT
jgi:hypothetical protein